MTEAVDLLPAAARVAGGDGAGVVLLVFQIAGREHALRVEDVVEVVRMVAASPLPEAPPWVVGVINFRGRVIPLIDVRGRIGAPAREADLSTPIVVVQNPQVAAGLVVDDVVEVLTVQSAALDSPGGADAPAHAVCGVAHVGHRLILVLDWERLCDGALDLGLHFDAREET